jgi:pseudouridine-5'-phosphate glycosidase/pseudouridine kinase
VIGSAAVDISARATPQSVDQSLSSHSTFPGIITLSLGGVGRNIAEAAHRVLASQGLPSATVLLSPVGDDMFGRFLVERTQQMEMRIDGLIQSVWSTAVSNMVLDSNGGLVGGVADMDIIKSMDENMVGSDAHEGCQC